MKKYILVFDLGTGNLRVAVTDTDGQVYAVQREDIIYETEQFIPRSLYFKPAVVWERLVGLARKAVAQAGGVPIAAVTSTSQRQGIVLMDQAGNPFYGMPNIDHRSESIVNNYSAEVMHAIQERTARTPSSLFSGSKLAYIFQHQPDLWQRIQSFCSMSDWVGYMLSGRLVYEPSQATETLLYDVRRNEWSTELADLLGLPSHILPPLQEAGTVLGPIRKGVAEALGISRDASVTVGAADTQAAIYHTSSRVDDVIIVSGTTTPVVQICDTYRADALHRSWTNSHVTPNRWILEANCGVTGLNYQHLKRVFYPSEPYDVMERELHSVEHQEVIACMGTIRTDTDWGNSDLGGMIFKVPLAQQLSRAHFMLACIWDNACMIKSAMKVIDDAGGAQPAYIWGCGGGFQSIYYRKMLASLLGKEIRIKPGYEQSSVLGAALLCTESLGLGSDTAVNSGYAATASNEMNRDDMYHRYDQWLHWRSRIVVPGT
ncbi:FGGY-family carbohydrate kinase [Paenibacillus piri]|nr:FGGY family carbohydrate kinase [Paenibacillus piri]